LTGSDRHPDHRRHRLVVMLAAIGALVVAVLLGPSLVTPGHTSSALASTSPTCTLSSCAAARTARADWKQLGFPTSRGWYKWPGGRYNYAGGQYYNNERELPAGASYNEYDVYPRAKGAHRDAVRIVVNRSTGATWYSPDHYADFYRLN
jgi:ribonuclease T1